MTKGSTVRYGELIEELGKMALQRYDSGTAYAHLSGVLSALLFSTHLQCSSEARIENEAYLEELVERNRLETATHILENAAV